MSPAPERSDGRAVDRSASQSTVSAADARARVEAARDQRRAERANALAEAFGGGIPGRSIIAASWIATSIQAVVSLLALIDPDAFLGAFFATTFALFLIGAAVFVVDLVLAAARSTRDAMGIGGLFFLAGAAPRTVQVQLNASLALAVSVAVLTAVTRISSPELAFGTLAPMAQLSLSGLWGVRHGAFADNAASGNDDG